MPIDTMLPVRHAFELHSTSTLTCCKPSEPTVSPAVEQVFNTTELLECILLHLGELDHKSWTRLFPVQRVNRRFHDVISASPAIRRTMFLAPAKSRLVAPSLPTVLDGYRDFFGAVLPVLKPFWFSLRPSSIADELILSMNVGRQWTEEKPGVQVGRAPDTKGCTSEDVSWRNLLLPYNPEQDLDMHCCGQPVTERFRNGVTLGELADQAVLAVKRHLGGMEDVCHYG